MKSKILLFAFLLSYHFCFSAAYYVAPNGSDSNNGTINHPVATISKAQQLASFGDMVYIRGGVYKLKEEQVAQYHHIWAYVTKLDKDGISYLSYKNEKPVFNFENIKPENRRVIAFFISGNNIKIKELKLQVFR